MSFFIVSDNMTGSHSLYTIYEGHEIMFHVSTMLPFTPDNPQQVTNMCSTLLCIKCKIVANFVGRLSFSTPMKGPGFKPWHAGADPGDVKWVNFHPPFFWAPFFLKVVFRPFQFQEKEKTKSGYKHNKKVSHGIFNLTFHMLQHTSSEVTVTKYDEIWKDKN